MSAGVSDLRRKGHQGGYTQNGDNNSGRYGMNGGYTGNSYSNGNSNGSWANQFNRNDGYQQQQQHHQGPPRPSINHRDNYDLKGAEQGIQGLSVNGSSSNSNNAQRKEGGGSSGGSSSKKMTWATIASQPAKPQVTTTSLLVGKKKGKGMPPPPMVPGKHNLDIGAWDTPVREPTPPPSPPTPPPVEPTPIPLNAEHQKAIEREEQQQKQRQGQNGPGGGHYERGGRDQHYRNENNNYGGYNRDSRDYRDNGYNNREKRPWGQRDNREQGPPQSYGGQNNNGRHHGGYNGNGADRGGYRNNYNNGYHNARNQSPPPHQQPPQQYRQQSPVQQQQQREDDEPVHSPHDRRDEHEAQQPRGGRHPGPARDAKVSISDSEEPEELTQEMLDKVMDKDNYNPPQLDLERGRNARFFVIKSYSEDDIHRSIKYEIWCSTEHGNKRLDQAFREREAEDGNVLLFFSVNGSGHFCGIAEMISAVDYNSKSTVWAQDKWRGVFKVKWIYVKDVPNTLLRQIRLENNENKPVTNSRDTQEVPNPKGLHMLEIIHDYQHTTSIFDDFVHYEKRQVEEVSRKHVVVDQPTHRDSMNSRGHYGRGGGGDYQNNRGYNGGDRPQYGNNRGYDGRDNYNRRGGYGGGGGHRDNYDGGNGYNNRDNRDNYDSGYQQRSFGPREDRDGGNFRRDYRDNNYRGGRNGGNNMMNNDGNNRGRWNHADE